MSKYRVEFTSSRLLLLMQLLTYGILVVSVLTWQSEIMPHQILLQALTIGIITFFIFNLVLRSRSQTQVSVILSLRGEWLETHKGGQESWSITNKSRVSSFLLFIHLISPGNARRSKWCLIYSDQVTKRDFRRLCRSIIYQQHTAGKG